MSLAHSPYLIVPGWGGSGPEHWQSLWTRDLDADRVELGNWLAPIRDVWVDAIDASVAAIATRDSRAPTLVAHSLGCIAVAHWARTSQHPIRAALLVAPADVEHDPCLPRLGAFGPVPAQALPFPSLVIASDDDPHVSLDRAKAFAAAWGSDLHVIRGGGHLNAASGLGRWRFGRALLARLLQGADHVREASVRVA